LITRCQANLECISYLLFSFTQTIRIRPHLALSRPRYTAKVISSTSGTRNNNAIVVHNLLPLDSSPTSILQFSLILTRCYYAMARFPPHVIPSPTLPTPTLPFAICNFATARVLCSSYCDSPLMMIVKVDRSLIDNLFSRFFQNCKPLFLMLPDESASLF
jgi:hypothetical protein